MADLGQLLGALLSSLVNARRIVDEETAMVAEYYKSEPLLEGMSMPRVRVPDMTIELPVLIEQFEEGEASVMKNPSEIHTAVANAFKEVIEKKEIALPAEFKANFNKTLMNDLKTLESKSNLSKRGLSRESITKTVESTFAAEFENLEDSHKAKVSPIEKREVISRLRETAYSNAVKKTGKPPVIKANILTSEIKERASEGTIPRIKISLKEEGLEWSVYEKDDGTVVKKLIPE